MFCCKFSYPTFANHCLNDSAFGDGISTLDMQIAFILCKTCQSIVQYGLSVKNKRLDY